ncbi:MAG: tail fiber domain-containing protein [Terriglobales bacterium]
MKLQPVHFDWNAEQYPDYHFGPGRNSGLLAQDVETVFPEMVSADARGFKMVNYSELPYLTLAAIRELKMENDSLRAQLAALEERLARLEKPQSKGTKKKPATNVRGKRMPVAKPQS